MGLMFRRRRPVMRLAAGAATAGVAYRAGKRAQQGQSNDPAASADDNTQGGSYAPPPPAAAAAPAGSDGGVGDLDHLVELHNQGVLSDAEFSAAKAKLLGI